MDAGLHARVLRVAFAAQPFTDYTFPFDVHTMISCEDAPALELALHRCRINKANPRKEFFKTDLAAIAEIVKQNHGEVQFVADVEALEYRQSQVMSAEDQEFIEQVYNELDEDGRSADDFQAVIGRLRSRRPRVGCAYHAFSREAAVSGVASWLNPTCSAPTTTDSGCCSFRRDCLALASRTPSSGWTSRGFGDFQRLGRQSTFCTGLRSTHLVAGFLLRFGRRRPWRPALARAAASIRGRPLLPADYRPVLPPIRGGRADPGRSTTSTSPNASLAAWRISPTQGRAWQFLF